LKEYEAIAECDKCGSLYYPLIEYKVGEFDPQAQENIHYYFFGCEIKDYLMRTCRNCGYKWPEKCKGEP